MRKYQKFSTLIISILVVAASLSFSLRALAATPTLSLASTGDGDSIQINATGDPNQGVLLYYTKADSSANLSSIGTTNSSGNLSIIVSTATYGVASNTPVHVIINGKQSSNIAWPYIAAGSTISLNQTSVVLQLNQTAAITTYNNGTNLLYLSNNSNPSIANVTMSGSSVSITGINYGSTIITICSQSSVSTCASAHVTVRNTSSLPILFSQNSPLVAAGQNVLISVYGGTGAYTIFTNSNANNIQSVINSNVVTLSTSGTSGASAITVCSTDMSSCGIINANISSASSAGMKLDKNVSTLGIGQSTNIVITGGVSGTYSIYSNTNPNAVQANVTSDMLTLSGLSNGLSVITICSSVGNCSAITATVSSAGSRGPIALSQNNLWVSIGQTFGITISGGSAPYSISDISNNNISAVINDNVLNITGAYPGLTSLNICSAGGACTGFSAMVNGNGVYPSISLSKNNITIDAGSTDYVIASGNGGYYAASNTNPNIATIVITNNSVAITAIKAGGTMVAICQNGGQCTNLTISVNNVITSTPTPTIEIPTAITAPGSTNASVPKYADNTLLRDQEGRIYIIRKNTKQRIASLAELKKYAGKEIIKVLDSIINQIPDTVVSIKFKFTKTLAFGAISNDVKELQKLLTANGFYKDQINGKFLSSTVAAVRKYQKSKGIKQTGNVGQLTMDALNK